MKKQVGYTLIELVIVIAMIGVMGASVVPAALQSMRSSFAASTTAVTLDKLRYAMDRMSYEIREMSAGSITTMTGTTLSFSRVDYYSASTSSTIAITIAQSGDKGKVNLSYSSPSVSNYTPVLVDGLYKGTTETPANGLSFTYYDSTYATTSTAADVRYVGIDLKLEAVVSGSTQSYSQRTLIALRN